MKDKTQALFAGSILALIFLLSFASATVSFSNVPTLSNSVGTHSASITITSDQNETVSFTLTPSTNAQSVIFSSISPIVLSSSHTSEVVSFNYTVPSTLNFAFNSQDYYVTLGATGTSSSSTSQKISFAVNDEYCSYGNTLGSDFQISDLSFDNLGKFGDDDVWYPLTEVNVELTLENNAEDDVNDAEIKWALYSDTGKLIMDGKESKVDVDSDDEQVVSFTIKLDENLDDLEDGTYTLYVKATGKADLDSGDEYVCTEESESVEVAVENDFVVLEDIQYQNDTVSCGSDLHITADVYNIGSDKQTDVYVRVYNSELGINKNIQIGDIKSMDSEGFDFTFALPQNLTAKTYGIQLEVYDEGDDIYTNDDDEEATYTLPVSIGSCTPVVAGMVAGGDVQSGGKAGQDLVVKVSVTNTGKSLTTYTVNPTSYTDWADSVVLDQSTVAISPGQTKDVILTFKTKNVKAGTYNFNTELIAGGKTIATQPFQLALESGSWFGNFNLNDSFGDNWYLWVIGALNVLLVLIIIIVAIRVARK